MPRWLTCVETPLTVTTTCGATCRRRRSWTTIVVGASVPKTRYCVVLGQPAVVAGFSGSVPPKMGSSPAVCSMMSLPPSPIRLVGEVAAPQQVVAVAAEEDVDLDGLYG